MRRRNVPLPAQYASAADDHGSTSTTGKLCQIWLSPAAMQVERHHFYCLLIAARSPCRFFDFFDFFSFFDSESNGKQLLNVSLSFVILTPVIAQHSRSDPTRHIVTSDNHVAAPTSLSLPFEPAENKSLASCGTAQSDGMRATSALIGRLCI